MNYELVSSPSLLKQVSTEISEQSQQKPQLEELDASMIIKTKDP